MTFSEMPYVRPDKYEVLSRYAGLTAALKAAPDFSSAERVFLDADRFSAGVETSFSLAAIRHSIDTRDPLYRAESDYADETAPLLEEGETAWNRALLDSPFRPQFENKYGTLLFVNAELRLRAFSPAIIPEMQEENALVTEYDRLIASARIPFENGVFTVAQMEPFMKDPDDARRRAAWVAAGTWFAGQRATLDALYDRLTRLRDAMGRKLGFDGYTDLGYCRMTRNCYGRDDVRRFREAVLAYVVPVAESVYRRQAERLGKPYPMDIADNALEFRSGNPRPAGDSEAVLAAGRKFYHELSPETAGFIDHMLDNGMMDVLARPGKAAGGYCADLPAHRTPFIFANFNGTQGDVEVITHEAGHAFEVYTARDVVPWSYHWPSLEACEVHSMSMEFFAWPWAEDFFGADADKYRFSHLASALTFLPYGALVDHFQHVVYEQPELSPAARTEVWKELAAQYLPWMKPNGAIPFYGEGRRWQRQGHIYQSPFYYIDYCLAQTMALWFWAAMQEDAKAAWAQYLRYTKLAGTMTFTELLETAGLPSPFDEGTLRGVCEKAAGWLDRFDLRSIDS